MIKKIETTIAEKTVWNMTKILRSENIVAITTLSSAVNIDKIRKQMQSQGSPPPSYTAIVLKAAALVMKRHPEANRAILGPPFFKRLYQFETIDINVAVEKSLPAMPGQPYAATIQNPLGKSLQVISDDLKKLINCTEENDKKFKLYMFILKRIPSPLSIFLINIPYIFPSLWPKFRGCAAWVNAPSKAGADLVLTCWPWPITFSFGFVKKRPFVQDDQVEAIMTIPLVMSFDRRIMGGGPASRIFATFVEIIESGDAELLAE